MKPKEKTSVGYDARLEYTRRLGDAMDRKSQMAGSGDELQWFLSLRSFYTLCRPFITTENKQEIDQELAILHNKCLSLNNVRSGMQRGNIRIRVLKKLQDVDDKIMDASKFLLLPSGADEYEDIDWDKVRQRGST